jgi:hypothetical protein
LGFANLLPLRLAKLAAAAHRMEEDLNVPDDVAALGLPRRSFSPDVRCLGLAGTRRKHT